MTAAGHLRRTRNPGALLAGVYLACILGFLYLPIAVMVVMAFNESVLYELPLKPSTIWFERLADNERLLRASANSVWLALANTVIATVLGTMVALAFARYRFRGRTLLRLLLFPPITIPWLIIGTAMLVMFFWIGIGRGLHAMLLGHVALSLPYVVVVVGARLASFGTELEAAAATLGANPWETFLRVTLPILAPGIVAAALFAFAVSFDQFVISYFLAAPGVSDPPGGDLLGHPQGFYPGGECGSSIIIVISMGVVLLFARLYRFGGEPGDGGRR